MTPSGGLRRLDPQQFQRGFRCWVAVSHFITSLPGSAQVVGQAIRAHWQIENGLHWAYLHKVLLTAQTN